MKAYYNDGLRNRTPGWDRGPMLDYGNPNAFLTEAMLTSALMERQRTHARQTELNRLKGAVVCQECGGVWVSFKGLPINYCSKCGAKINKEVNDNV